MKLLVNVVVCVYISSDQTRHDVTRTIQCVSMTSHYRSRCVSDIVSSAPIVSYTVQFLICVFVSSVSLVSSKY